MFSIRIPLQNRSATVKLSQARQEARLTSTTKGLAFKYVAQGCEHYQVKGQDITLHAGEFLLLPQGRDFTAVAEPRTEVVSGICVDFLADVETLADELSRADLLFAFPLPVSFLQLEDRTDPLVNNLTLRSSQEFVKRLKQATAALSAKAQDVQPILASKVRKTSTQQHLFVRLHLAHQYIKQHYRKRLRLVELSQASGISAHRLQRLFRAIYGQSPQQMQTQLRMEEGKSLLANPQLAIQEIAFHLGFTDLAAFSNQFLQVHGLRPTQMRQQLLSAKR